ncbi:hypothetical protein Asi03nite_13550 [Actinoplanes siamensis]|uniref:Uncharacterized protein n=1 Tax=Actinoplanes siamensis TaxID=1223317 RepID=A0A919TI11_9ACTN|nr:hypothetical protein Asi03nite_13550 [Actinoplanes siamensis]
MWRGPYLSATFTAARIARTAPRITPSRRPEGWTGTSGDTTGRAGADEETGAPVAAGALPGAATVAGRNAGAGAGAEAATAAARETGPEAGAGGESRAWPLESGMVRPTVPALTPGNQKGRRRSMDVPE